MISALARLLLALTLLYAIYAGIMYAGQGRLLFPVGDTPPRPFHAVLPANAELIELPVSFGRMRFVRLRAARHGTPVPALIFFHGNLEKVEDILGNLEATRAVGLDVLMIEYPGYAGADGRPSLASIGEVSEQAYDWLARQPDIDAKHIAAMGVSIGGGPAAELTRRRPLQALFLLSSFTSVATFANDYGLPGWLVRDAYDSEGAARIFAGNLFVAHGRRDVIIPFLHGQRLSAATHDAQFVALDCGHADCPYRTPLFAQSVAAFLRAHGWILAGDDAPDGR